MKLNSVSLSKWFADNGDYTHNITYDLNEDSKIMDLGGYNGVWAQQIIDKYNPYVYIIEPVSSFYDNMVSKFLNNNKVELLNVGVGIENKDGMIYMNGDGTSSNLTNGKSIKVEFNTMESILEKFKLDKVDLLQINIEGDEYPILEKMLESETINRFKNIQIQFHLGVDNEIQRRDKIREGLVKNNFKIKFDYPFVWESWSKN
jgi:FkbM family methyltransferase